MSPLYVFLIDTGSCGACAAEVWATVERTAALRWAATPATADVVVLVGVPTLLLAPAVRQTLIDATHLPLVAVGRCTKEALVRTTTPFLPPDMAPRRIIDGCPALPTAIAEGIQTAMVRIIGGL